MWRKARRRDEVARGGGRDMERGVEGGRRDTRVGAGGEEEREEEEEE